MYIGIDVGGTKTLVAVLNEHGVIKEQTKFPTPKKYDYFLLELRHAVAHLETQNFKAAGVAAPGRIDRRHGRVVRLSNLPWENAPLQSDCERLLHCPVVIENDANLAALSEAMLHPKNTKILYVTISTGIGTGIVDQQQLDPSMLDSEGGQVLLTSKDTLTTWEKLGAGRIIYKHFGKKAADIPASDVAAWKYIVRTMAVGLFTNIVIVQPDLVIIGGSIGTYFNRYSTLLEAELERYRLPVVKLPKLVQAQRPEEAVVYGCYDLAKQVYGHASADH
jgi:glucokinase